MAEQLHTNRGLHLRLATHILRSRRRRAHLLPEHREIFGEPAWDILLRLFISTERRDKVTMSHVARSIDLPITTVQRRAEQLSNIGLVTLYNDDVDTRCRLARLTCAGVGKMEDYLDRHYVRTTAQATAIFGEMAVAPATLSAFKSR
jgi:DNA-binding MarR family transcriptional regulator